MQCDIHTSASPSLLTIGAGSVNTTGLLLMTICVVSSEVGFSTLGTTGLEFRARSLMLPSSRVGLLDEIDNSKFAVNDALKGLKGLLSALFC